METKHLVALLLLTFIGSAGLCATLLSQRVRDAALFLFLVGVVWAEKINVTLLGLFWYRGTSRGIEIAAVDLIPLCLVVATLLAPRYPHRRFEWPASLGWLLLYVGYCCLSVLHAHPQLQGVWELVKTFRGLLVFLGMALFVRTRREVAVVVFALCCTAVIESTVALHERFALGAFRASGTFDHENTLSTYLCMIAPVLLAAALADWNKWLRRFAAFSWVCAAGGELLTLSRLGIPVFFFVSAATVVSCASWTLPRLRPRLVLLAGAAIGLCLLASWDGLVARYGQSNLRAELTGQGAFESRGVYWRTAFGMVRDEPWGVGLNTWSYHVGKTYDKVVGYDYLDYDRVPYAALLDEEQQSRLAPAADSLPALTLGELGYVGFVLLSCLWLRWFHVGSLFLVTRLNHDPMHRMAIGCLFSAVAVFCQSATEWTYRQTPILFTLHVIIATLSALHHVRAKAHAPALRPRRSFRVHRAPEYVAPPSGETLKGLSIAGSLLSWGRSKLFYDPQPSADHK